MTTTTKDADDWVCPICLDICYKPTVNTCGHVFCFWCMHRAMDRLANSKCPVCRQEYAHFPTVCAALHGYLQQAFPEEYAKKGQLVEEQEEHMGAQSAAVLEQEAAQGVWRGFACASCQQLAGNPRVLACGHFICPKCDLPGVCPCCKALVRSYTPASRQIRDLVSALFPCPLPQLAAAQQRRGSAAEEISQQATIQERTGSAAEDISQQATAHTLTSPDTQARPPDSGAGGGPELPSASLGGTPAAPSSEALQASTTQPGSQDISSSESQASQEIIEEFLHAGVGCDGCGESPIRGRRFRCMDCPEAIGFDLCQDCYQHCQTQPLVRGRFNQTHTSGHRMELVTMRRGNMMQAMFTDLMEQSLQYWQLQAPHMLGDLTWQLMPGPSLPADMPLRSQAQEPIADDGAAEYETESPSAAPPPDGSSQHQEET